MWARVYIIVSLRARSLGAVVGGFTYPDRWLAAMPWKAGFDEIVVFQLAYLDLSCSDGHGGYSLRCRASVWNEREK